MRNISTPPRLFSTSSVVLMFMASGLMWANVRPRVTPYVSGEIDDAREGII
ncbi:MAG: hypothetical protein NTW87_07655 [Planctomycetota bacterium]|nr:hypothetical protein [Planctomycetota bacterium]